MSMGSLQAGAARTEITPERDVSLAGEVGWFRPGKYVDSPLYARALILEQVGQKLCFISLDVTIVTEDVAQKIRAQIASACDIAPEAIMVHATQVHAAPALGSFMYDKDFPPMPEGIEWLAGGVAHYAEFATQRIVAAAVEANTCLESARLRVGSGIEGRIQFNRRAVTNDGSVRMPGPNWPEPLGPTYIRYLEGPTDPEVGVVCIQGQSARPIALLLHHTGHPVNVFPQAVISSDWPGAWAAEMEQLHPNSIALVANGCCGNINPWNPFDPDYKPDHKLMGRRLAEVTQRVLEQTDVEEDEQLITQSCRLPIRIREVEPELLAKSQALLAEHPEPTWNVDNAYQGYEGGSPVAPGTKVIDSEWILAASIVSVHLQQQREKNVHYEIQAFRIGRAALVGLAGEPFVEGQLQIKMASPAYRTLVAHCCNMYSGYLPIAEAFPRGGHEVETRFWSKLAPEALAMVVDKTNEVLQDLFA